MYGSRLGRAVIRDLLTCDVGLPSFEADDSGLFLEACLNEESMAESPRSTPRREVSEGVIEWSSKYLANL